MDCTITDNCISRTACEPECPNIFSPDFPEPTCAPVASKSNAFDGQTQEQAPALTEDDYHVVALALLLVSGIWQITSSYLK